MHRKEGEGMRAIEEAYRLAKEQYAAIGVDTDAVLEKLAGIEGVRRVRKVK